LERRTNRPRGSGGASPTVVTARAGSTDVDDDTGEETLSANVIAANRTSRLRAGQPASSNGNGSDGTAHGSVATSDAPASSANDDPAVAEDLAPDDSARTESASGAEPDAGEPAGAEPAAEASASAAQDATLATAPANGHRTDDDNDDTVPGYPADGILPSRVSRFKNGTDDHFLDSSSPAFSFGEPETAPVSLSTDRWTPGDSTETHQEPSVSDPSPAEATSAVATAESSTAEPSAVSPAAFAWEMPDPPPDSPSSPARSFLRTGSAPPKTPTAAKTPAAGTGTATADAGSATRAARGEPPVTFGGMPKKRPSKKSARQAHLTVARVEPWSVMKFSFVVSLVAFVILFVAVSVLYGALSGLGVFDSLQRVVTSVTSSQSSAGVNAAKWWSASRILGYTALLGSLNIVLITAMSTIGAVVYNLTSRLVGGVEVTLRETE
jgi:Transmembrane domain of unknown function (DUF3566)